MLEGLSFCLEVCFEGSGCVHVHVHVHVVFTDLPLVARFHMDCACAVLADVCKVHVLSYEQRVARETFKQSRKTWRYVWRRCVLPLPAGTAGVVASVVGWRQG